PAAWNRSGFSGELRLREGRPAAAIGRDHPLTPDDVRIPAGIQGDRRPDEIEIALIPVAPGPEPRRHVRDDDLLRAVVLDPYLLRDPEMAPYRMERAEKMGMVRTAREFRAHLREGLRCAPVVVVEKQYVAAAGLRHDPVALGMSPIPGGAMFGIFD